MSAIAYITDSKMLELHRLNNHKTMNFWRLSTNINFSDFGVGDLVFFLSKDKEHKKKNEKGVVGFGRLKGSSVSSVKKMWDTYQIYNGYKTLDEFKEAIIRVSKDKKLPRKISSLELENVTFFQPVYLSECGIDVSNKVESYIYLKPEEVVFDILSLANHSEDIWSSLNGIDEAIEEEKKLYAIYLAHKNVGDLLEDERGNKRARRNLQKYLEVNPEYKFIQGSNSELFNVEGNQINILIYNDKYINKKEVVAQAALYRYYIERYLGYNIKTKFKVSNDDEELNILINSI